MQAELDGLGVLTQEHLDEKGKAKNHPICYISGQFRGRQLNWAALTKESYAIYMSVQRLSFYMTDAEVTIRSDHLPLKKFLNKQTMNSKVKNWGGRVRTILTSSGMDSRDHETYWLIVWVVCLTLYQIRRKQRNQMTRSSVVTVSKN